MYRFAQSYGVIIGKAPLQAYCSALIFSPARSLTRQLFTSKEPDWIVQKPRVDEHWNSCLATLFGHHDWVTSVAFSPNGHHIVSGSYGGIIKIWDAESGTEILTLHGHTGLIWSLAFDEEGEIITSESDDQTVKLWDVKAGACIETRNGSREPSSKSAFSTDKRRHATCTQSGSFHVVDSVSNEVIIRHDPKHPYDPDECMYSFAFSRDGRFIASGSLDRTVTLWNAVTGIKISTLRGHNGVILSVCFSPDARRIASGSWDGTIKIWDVESSPEISTPQDHYSHRHRVNSVALTRDGRRIASGSEDKTVNVWDAETGQHIRTLKYEFEGYIHTITFSPDGCYFAIAGDTSPFIISDAESGGTISKCDHPPFIDGPLGLSLRRRYIATEWKGAVNVQSTEDSETVCTLKGHWKDVSSLAFSPKDCHIVVSASFDKTIMMWNVLDGTKIATFNAGTEIRRLRFDSTSACLHTDSSSPIQDSPWLSNSTPSNTQLDLPRVMQYDYGVDLSRSWITWRGQNVLWLPPEFRETGRRQLMACNVAPHLISIGCASGRLWWIRFSSKHHPLTDRYLLE